MFAVAEGWKQDFDTDEHQERKGMTKNFITRYVKKEVERRVTSSLSSESFFVTDCCWAPSPFSHTFMFCALSSGHVCMLNINNLSKAYLFEEYEKDGERREKDVAGRHTRERKGTHRSARVKEEAQKSMQLVSIDCAILEANTSSATTAAVPPTHSKMIFCMALDGWVQTCLIDAMAPMSELRRLRKGKATKVLEFQRSAQHGVMMRQIVRFSPSGSRVCVLQSFALGGAGQSEELERTVSTFIAVLRRGSGNSIDQFSVELSWRQLLPSPCSPAQVHLIRHFGWWDEEFFLCLWSSGCLQLLNAKNGTTQSDVQLLRCAHFNTVLFATGTPCAAPFFGGGKSVSTAEVQMGLLAAALDNNIVVTFNVYVMEHQEAEAKRSRRESAQDFQHGLEKRYRVLSLKPTQQTFYTEDIPVSSLALFHVFSWTLCITLESGAVLFVDALTMDLLLHRPLRRHSGIVDAFGILEKRLTTNRVSFTCFPLGKPLSIAVLDHNTITLFKS